MSDRAPFPTSGRGDDYDRVFAYWFRRFQGHYGGSSGYPHGVNPSVEDEAKRAARRAVELEQQRQERTLPIKHAVAGLPPASRVPGGGKRRPRRSRDRPLPPMPEYPPMLNLLERVVLAWEWNTRSRRNDLWRLRAVVALCVVLAVKRCTPMTRVCAMLPHEVLCLPMPFWARRRVRKWLNFRSGFYGASPGHNTSYFLPWLSLPKSKGDSRSVAWSIGRMLAWSKAPCWRVRQLLRGPRWFVPGTRIGQSCVR